MVRLTGFVLSRPRSVLVAWLILLAAGGDLSVQLDGALRPVVSPIPAARPPWLSKRSNSGSTSPPTQCWWSSRRHRDSVATHLDAARTALEQARATFVADYRSRPSWISTDDRTTFLQVGFRQDDTAVQNLVSMLEREVGTAVGPDVRVNVTGQPALDYALNVRSKQDAARAEIIALPILIVILFLVFRSIVAMAIPLILAAASLAVSSGIGYLIARATDLSILYSNIVSMIGLAVAVDYSLFVIRRFRDELDRGHEVDSTVRRTMASAGRSAVFSGSAVLVALSALFIPPGDGLHQHRARRNGGHRRGSCPVHDCATGGAAAGRAAHQQGRNTTTTPAAVAADPSKKDRFARFLRRPGLLLGASLTALTILALPTSRLVLQSSVASATILPADDSARVGMEMITRDLVQGNLFPNADFRTAGWRKGLGVFVVECAVSPPGDGGVGGEFGLAEDG